MIISSFLYCFEKYKNMTGKDQNIRSRISEELKKQFPGQKTLIAELTETSFTYELEKHGNYSYYRVKYDLSPTGTINIDWENAELTVI
jgi:hypothetical protein